MAGQDFTVERHDSWPKTEESLGAIADAIGYILMLGDIVITEKIPEFIIKNLQELNQALNN